MDNAVVPLNNPTLVATPASVSSRVAALPGRAKLMAGIGVAALAAVLVALALSMQQGDYKVLFANLSEKDGGPIIEKLAQMNKDNNAYEIARTFAVQNVIRPEETRAYLINMLEIHALKLTNGVGQHLMRAWPTSH